MATEVVTLRCPGCGFDRKPGVFGLAEDGSFDAENAQPNELCMRVRKFGGRARLECTTLPAPRHFALGLRAMLKARLAQVEAELALAGIELPDD